MRLILRCLLPVLLVLTLQGCSFDLPPINSAYAIEYVGGAVELNKFQGQRRWELSKSQLQSLDSWFQSHRSGWSSSYASYVSTAEIKIIHSDGSSSSVGLSASGLVVVNSGGSQVTQQFEAALVKQLLMSVGATNG